MNKVSVIVPCYNQSRFLPEALQSIKEQTYSNWECIIVNDGSTDDTAQVSKGWCASDSRYKYVEKKNGGLSSARNEGLKYAEGEYIQFLDADDLIDLYKFEIQLTALASSGNSFIAISDHFPFDDQSKEYLEGRYLSPFIDSTHFKKEIISEWEYRRSIPCHNVLVPMKIISDHNLRFAEDLPNHEDWVFWCQVLFYSEGVVYQNEKLAKYRIRPASMSANQAKMVRGFIKATYKLEQFYKEVNNQELLKVLSLKRGEIKQRNKKSSYISYLYYRLKA